MIRLGLYPCHIVLARACKPETDKFYSNIDDEEKKNRIDSMFEGEEKTENQSKEYEEFLEFLAWKKARNQ